MKKLAILIACHKNPQQINLLVDKLAHPQIDIFLHVDKKSNIQGAINDKRGVYFISDLERVSVEWAQISQVEATLKLIQLARETYDYEYYIYISGEDWPCCDISEIVELIYTKQNHMYFWDSLYHGGKFNHYDKRNSLHCPLFLIGRKVWQRVIRRLYVELTGGYNHTFKLFYRNNPLNCKFYFGSSWWGLNKETIEWSMNFLADTPQFYLYYYDCLNPDESFFQTLVMLSPFADDTTDYLTYLNFLPGANSPEYLSIDNIKEANQSKYLFMRKLDLAKLCGENDYAAITDIGLPYYES